MTPRTTDEHLFRTTGYDSDGWPELETIIVREIKTIDPNEPIIAKSMDDLPDILDVVLVPSAEKLGQVIGFTNSSTPEETKAGTHRIGIHIAEYPRKQPKPTWIIYVYWFESGRPTDDPTGKRCANILN